MLWNNVICNQSVKDQLVSMVENNKLSHALLLVGKEGTAALPLALAFAQYLVSIPAPVAAVDDLFGPAPAVSEAPSFIHPADIATHPASASAFSRASQLLHPDLHITVPTITRKTGEKPVSSQFMAEFRSFVQQQPYGNVYQWLQFIKAENKQGNITAEECNQIIRRLSLKNFESFYKVQLIWMAEYLHQEGNKLLKTIEEPTPNTIIILVAEDDSKVLNTILSRCRRIQVPKIETAQLQDALQQQFGISSTAAQNLVAYAQGNINTAVSAVKNGEVDSEWLPALRTWLNMLVKGSQTQWQEWLEVQAKLGRENQKQFLQYVNHIFSQCLYFHINPALLQVTGTEAKLVEKIALFISVAECEAAIGELDKAAYYIERNANPKLLFHAVSIKLKYIMTEKILLLTE
jgi:DNA polymerase-3 subunit delta'